MNLLLDTHIWIWSIQRPAQLSSKLRRAFQKSGTELYLSPVSLWEAHLLAQRGRLRLRQAFSEWIEEMLAKVPLREAPFTLAVAREASRISLPQPDPGDLFIAATAVVFDLTLVTADSQLLACSWLRTLAND